MVGCSKDPRRCVEAPGKSRSTSCSVGGNTGAHNHILVWPERCLPTNIEFAHSVVIFRSRRSDNIFVFGVAPSWLGSVSNAANRFCTRMVGFVIIVVAGMRSLECTADSNSTL